MEEKRIIGSWEVGKYNTKRRANLCRCLNCGTEAFRSITYLKKTLTCQKCKAKNTAYYPQDIPKGLIKENRKLYARWRTMLDRCHNTNGYRYPLYGARGITVCEEWKNLNGFSSFVSWIKQNYPNYLYLLDQRYDLDRIDNDGPYSPENCRLVPHSENIKNRRNTIKIDFLGSQVCLSDFAAANNIPYQAALKRYNEGRRGNDLLTPGPKKPRINKVKVIYLGEQCYLEDLVLNFSLNDYKTVELRVRRNWDIEDALLTPKGRKNPIKRVTTLVKFKGAKHSLRELQENFSNLSYQTIYNRVVNCGWDVEKALTTPLDKKPRKGGGR